MKQDCVPVGCVPPARWPYLPACSAPGGSWSRGCLVQGSAWSGGVPDPGGGGCGGAWSGGCAWSGGWYPSMHWGTHPPVNRMTNRCKNITLPQTSFAGGNKKAFQTNVNHLLSDSPSIIVNKFEHVWKAMYSEVQVAQVWTYLGWGWGHCMMESPSTPWTEWLTDGQTGLKTLHVQHYLCHSVNGLFSLNFRWGRTWISRHN